MMKRDKKSKPSGTVTLRPSMEALKIALPYLVIGFLWIGLSDRLLDWMQLNVDSMVWIQSLKGWFYVALTAVLLYMLVLNLVRGLKHQQDHLDDLVIERTAEYEMAKSRAEQISNEKEQSQQMLWEVLDNIPIGIYWKDKSDRVLGCNQFIADCMHAELKSMVGRTASEFSAGRPSVIYSEEDKQILDSGEPKLLYQESFETDAGNIRIFNMNKLPLMGRDGNIYALLGVAEDVTEQKYTEIELIRAKQDANAANKAKSEFLSRMSHEIRTPLNSIIGLTHIAEQTRDVDKLLDYLAKVDLSSQHLLQIINDILDISRIEAGKMSISVKEFDLTEAIEEVCNIIMPRVEEKKQHFNVILDPNIPNVKSDPIRIKQVLMNLLSNAVKFTQQFGTITLRVRTDRQIASQILIHFSVTDNGIGIKEDQLGLLFQQFEQADGSNARAYEGTGLGLAISKNIVELLDGHIHVESREGQGSTFRFSLPFEIAEPRAYRPEILFNSLRALVVDDEYETCEYMKSLLSELEVHADTACSGEMALDAVLNAVNAGQPYHVVFVDWRMPGMNGIQTAREIKRICGENTIVIMISMYEWQEIEHQAKEAGISMFLSKPIFPSSLLSVLNDVANRPKKHEAKQSLQEEAGLFSGKHILIAEDMPINQLIVREMLKDTGVQITPAEDGRAAIDLYLADPESFDVILMDIQMPNMDGYEAAKRIRSSNCSNAKTIPIIAMTANVFKEDIDEALMAGIDDHIGKPIDYQDLVEKLRKRLT